MRDTFSSPDRLAKSLRRVGAILDKWASFREALFTAPSRYQLHYPPFPKIHTYVPNDRLCWALTFEIILKGLTKAEYRALVAWYRARDYGFDAPYTSALNSAARYILGECRRRDFR